MSYPFFILESKQGGNVMYQFIYKRNYMCICCASSLIRLADMIAEMYKKTKGSIEFHLDIGLENLEYNPAPPPSVLEYRKSVQEEMEEKFNDTLEEALEKGRFLLKKEQNRLRKGGVSATTTKNKKKLIRARRN